jgi:hypothetical protein
LIDKARTLSCAISEERHDPKAASVVDHHRLHGLETQNQAFLCDDKNDRGDDSDDRCDKSQPIVKRLWLGKA